MDKKIDEKQLAALEQERNEALVRVVNRVRQSQNTGLGAAAHTSGVLRPNFIGPSFRGCFGRGNPPNLMILTI